MINLKNRRHVLVGSAVWVAALIGSLRLYNIPMPTLHGLCGGWG